MHDFDSVTLGDGLIVAGFIIGRDGPLEIGCDINEMSDMFGTQGDFVIHNLDGVCDVTVHGIVCPDGVIRTDFQI